MLQGGVDDGKQPATLDDLDELDRELAGLNDLDDDEENDEYDDEDMEDSEGLGGDSDFYAEDDDEADEDFEEGPVSKYGKRFVKQGLGGTEESYDSTTIRPGYMAVYSDEQLVGATRSGEGAGTVSDAGYAGDIDIDNSDALRVEMSTDADMRDVGQDVDEGGHTHREYTSFAQFSHVPSSSSAASILVSQDLSAAINAARSQETVAAMGVTGSTGADGHNKIQIKEESVAPEEERKLKEEQKKGFPVFF